MRYFLWVVLVAALGYGALGLLTGGFSASVEDRIVVAAAPERVWDVLTDFSGYPEWNPAMRFTKHDFAPGKEVSFVVLNDDGSDGMTISPTVLEFERPKSIVWRGSLWIPGLFDGTHSFALREHPDGVTELVQSEEFFGLLIPVTRKNVIRETGERFRRMDEALKKQAERSS